MIEHGGWIRHRRPNLLGPRPHGSGLSDPLPGALVHSRRPQPGAALQQFDKTKLGRLPAESSLRMTLEEFRCPHRSERARRSLLQPAQNITGSDHDDDRLEARIAWKDALEDSIEAFRSHPGSGDVAHVDL